MKQLSLFEDSRQKLSFEDLKRYAAILKIRIPKKFRKNQAWLNAEVDRKAQPLIDKAVAHIKANGLDDVFMPHYDLFTFCGKV